MLADAELPDIYWWDTLQYAVLLHNVSLTHALEDCSVLLKKPGAATSPMSHNFAFSAVVPSYPSRTRCAVNCPPSHSSTRSSATPSSSGFISLSMTHRVALLSPTTVSSTREGEQQHLQAYYHRCQRRRTATHQSPILTPFHFHYARCRSRYH